MELAIHIRNIEHATAFCDLPNHIATLYAEKQDWSALMPSDTFLMPSDTFRLYSGDEFCIHRLPHPAELAALVQLATEKRWQLTLLTPPLSDAGLETCKRLFDYLQQETSQTEVVVNDWGVLLYLEKNYPSFELSAGRLLNKGFKDPRLPNASNASQFSDETASLFNHGTFDFPGFQQTLSDFQVRRIERDVLPYEDLKKKRLNGLSTSIYFPYGYITTGRICWIASFNERERRRFRIADGCQRRCNQLSLRLKHDQTSMKLFQEGNTIFYRYSLSTSHRLVTMAKQNRFRLIYQGFAIPGSEARRGGSDRDL